MTSIFIPPPVERFAVHVEDNERVVQRREELAEYYDTLSPRTHAERRAEIVDLIARTVRALDRRP